MAGQVCVDASLILALLLPHDDLTTKVEALWERWAAADVEFVAPPLLFAEVTSVLRAAVFFGRIPAERGEEAFAAFMSMGLRQVDPPDLQPRAWALAKAHHRPKAYDAQYLAIADTMGCELWTGDRRFVHAVRLPTLRWVGEDVPSAG